jgi:hypothetical protein
LYLPGDRRKAIVPAVDNSEVLNGAIALFPLAIGRVFLLYDIL